MFKQLRRSRAKQQRHGDPESDDDSAPMLGTSYKSRTSGRAFGDKQQPQPYGQQQQQRSSSAGRNANTKLHKHLGKQQRHVRGKSGVSWISDNCSETDVTETWTMDVNSEGSSDQGSEGSGGDFTGTIYDGEHEGSTQGSAISGASGISEEQSQASSCCTEEDNALRLRGGAAANQRTPQPYGGASKNSGPPGSREEGLTRGLTKSNSRKYFTDDEASYPSVGQNVKKAKQPPPPPRRGNQNYNRKGSVDAIDMLNSSSLSNNMNSSAMSNNREDMQSSSMSLGENSVRSTNSNSRRGRSEGGKKKGQGPKRRSASGGSRGSKTADNGPPNRKISSAPNLQRKGTQESRGDKSVASTIGARSVATEHSQAQTVNTSYSHKSQATQNTNATSGSRESLDSRSARLLSSCVNVLDFKHNDNSSQTEMKLKPPSMKGMPTTKGKYHRRSSSGGASAPQSGSSGATVATSASEGNKSEGAGTEVAAMQQLAYLVVSLRSDLREANLARDELEGKLEEANKKPPGSSAGSDANPYGDDSKVQQLEKENAEFQADVDAFIEEQDDLKSEIAQLKDEKGSLNDMLSRLKGSGSSVPELEGRIKDLTDANRKLEGEIQVKSALVASGDSQVRKMDDLTKSLEEKDAEFADAMGEKDHTMGEMRERIASLEGERDQLEKEANGHRMGLAVLEDELEAKDEDAARVRDELKSEGTKMTLLRNRLDQVEKQKRDLGDKNAALDRVLLGLKKKVEECLKERNSTRSEMESLRSENETMKGQLKMRSSNAIAKQAGEADTLLNLQKMIASLEEAKGELEEEIDHKDEELKFNAVKISNLEGKVRAATGSRCDDDDDNLVAECEDLKGRVAELTEGVTELTSENEDLEEKIEELQEQIDELEELKEGSAKTIQDLEDSLAAAEDSLQAAKKTSDAAGPSQDDLDAIADLEDAKAELEEEMNEATDAIAMLEDELDNKDGQVRELLTKLTMFQQQFSQVDKCKTALAERNAKLSSENDDLSTQVKVLIIEKKVASEEIETLKTMHEIADEDQEEKHDELLAAKQEQRQEIDGLHDRLHELHAKTSEQTVTLEQQVYRLEEDLEEGNDAIAMLREALTELEEGKVERDDQIKSLGDSLGEKASSLEIADMALNKLRGEHQVSVDTISNLQKMIASLERSKEDLEEELNESSFELTNLKEKLKKKNTLTEVTDLESKLGDTERDNRRLTKRIKELSEANDKMKDEVKDLGESLAKVTARSSQPMARSLSRDLLSSSDNFAAAPSGLVSSDPVASCDALINELKSQIKEIVSARNAALEEVEQLRSDASVVSHPTICSSQLSEDATMPPPSSGVETKLAPVVVSSPHVEEKATLAPRLIEVKTALPPPPLDDSIKDEDDQDDKTLDHKSMAAYSTAPSAAGSRGSSLLEAAKKLCDQLDEKRSKEEGEKISNAVAAAKASRDRSPPSEAVPIKNIMDQEDDVSSAKEVKEDLPMKEILPPAPAPPREGKDEKKDDQRRSSTKPRFDIDQLTSIYFEKCGMSVSKFSDLSSDSSSFRRRAVKAPSDTVTKKVKICRNGVFMGTYEGDLNSEGQRHGFGVLLCDNGNSYEGEWKKDKRDGLGIARYSSGDVYDGQWQRGKRQGHGVMYIEAGDTYIGSWNNGLKHGAGTYHWADGEVDVSWYEEDRRVGEGVRWNASRSKAFRLIRGTKKEELSLDEAYMTAEKLGLNLEKFDSGVP